MSADKAREELARVLFGAVMTHLYGEEAPEWGDAGWSQVEFMRNADAVLAAGYVRVTEDAETVEHMAREAFWTDDVGGHHRPGSRPHTWENIPEEGRENYRTLIRAALRALRGES